MARLQQVLEQTLRDRKITDNEVQTIRTTIAEDGRLDTADVGFLVRLLTEADEVCPAFDALFFPILKQLILQDGRIDQAEGYHLLKILFSRGRVRPQELAFLKELRAEADEVPAEFDGWLEEATATSV